MKKWLGLILSVVLLTALACGAALAEDEVTVALSAEALYVKVGGSVNVKATVEPRAASRKGVTYAVSDEAVATVSNRGVVKGVAAGDCTLTVTSAFDDTASASIPVHVVVPVKKVTLSVNDLDATIHVGETLQLTPAFEPTDATVQSVVYSTSKDTIAVVSEDGVVTGVGKGAAVITATSADGYAKASYKLTVKQQPEGVDINSDELQLPIGKKQVLKAVIHPTDADDKSVTWSSADESIATVNAKGQVSIQGIGETTITVTCNDNPSISASIPVRGLELAKSVAFDAKKYSVLLGETTQLYVNVQPDDTTDKGVTYKVKNPKICTVDENGVVTALKGGSTTVYAYTIDGSKKRASTTVEVIVPVTGVSYKYKDLRVGAGYHGTFTADIEPKDATYKDMTWVSSDESIATVSGTTNRFKISGRKWGRCKVTGTTADGGFTVTINVDIGSLRHAVTVVTAEIRNGKPYIVLKNRSNMNITDVYYRMVGYDGSFKPIEMSKVGDKYVLKGAYEHPLAEGERTTHGQFNFFHPTSYKNMQILQFCITGWSTDTGYYDHNGTLQYDYTISESNWSWVTYPASTDDNQLLY